MALAHETNQTPDVGRNTTLVAKLKQAVLTANGTSWFLAKNYLENQGFQVKYDGTTGYLFSEIRNAIDSNHVLVGGWGSPSPPHIVAYIGYELPDIVIVNDPYGGKWWFDSDRIPGRSDRDVLKNAYSEATPPAYFIGADPRTKGRLVKYRMDELPSRGHFLWITGGSHIQTSDRVALSPTSPTSVAVGEISAWFPPIASTASQPWLQSPISTELRVLTSTVPLLNAPNVLPLRTWEVQLFDDTGTFMSSTLQYSVSVQYAGLLVGLGDLDTTTISEIEAATTRSNSTLALQERNLRLYYFDIESAVWEQKQVTLDQNATIAHFVTTRGGKYVLAYVRLSDAFLPRAIQGQ